MEKEKYIETLKAQGYNVEENSAGLIYCYECSDFTKFRKAVRATGYTRSFGATPYKKDSHG